jgi:hypothetical protein
VSNKYHARKTFWAGEWWDSAGEARYAQHLEAQKAAGAIRDWRRGRRWALVPGVTLTPDFEVTLLDGTLEARDFKGLVTEVFRIKAAVWAQVHADVPLVVVRADGTERRVA